MQTIKAIFFDAGDTLFEPREQIGMSYARFAVSHGLCDTTFLSQGSILNQRFKIAFTNAPPMAYPNQSQSSRSALEQQWWRDRVSWVFENFEVPKFEPFFDALYTYFGKAAAWRLFPETLVVLEKLKKQGLALSIVSNFDSRLPEVCRQLGLAEFFDRIIFSSAQSAAKPEAPIYHAALQKAGYEPAEVLFVGDNPATDVAGPEAVGIRGLLLDRKGRYDDQKSSNRIQNLSALADRLISD